MTRDDASPRDQHPSQLAAILLDAFHRKGYSSLLQTLHDNKPTRATTRDPKTLVEAWGAVLDAAQLVIVQLNEADRPLFYSLLHTGLGMDYLAFLRSKEEFFEGISVVRKESLYRIEQEHLIDALFNHPFAKSMREEFMMIDRAAALATVEAAWSSGDISAFLYVVSTLTSTQNQIHRRTDPGFSDGRFSDAIASHPGLELVIIPVERGNPMDMGDHLAPLPPLKLIVSNKPLPVEYEEQPTDHDNRDFILASATGTYLSLKRYMVDALSNRHESIGHGPYYFASNDDRGLAPASNVIAAIHHYVDVPTNFAFNAQERLREQLREITNAAVGPIYAHRYLRAAKSSDWSEALNYANRTTKELTRLDHRAVAETLVTHGFSNAVESLLTHRSPDDENAQEARIGYLQGISLLHSDMIELIHGDGEMTEALERFERYRGFHPDILMFPIEERARLAFQDISDMMVAHLTGLTIVAELFDENRPLVSKIDIPNIVRTMIVAGDITNAMRVLENPGIKRNPDIIEAINKNFRSLGYYVFQEFKLKQLGDFTGRAVIDSQANLYTKPSKRTAYLSVDQITAGSDLLAAKLAYELLNSLNFKDGVGERPAEQISALKDFIARQSLVKELKDNMGDIPYPLKSFYLDGIRLEADVLADHLAMKGVKNPQEAVREAISEVSGNKPKAAFHRVMRALGNVSGLMSGKSPK